MDNTVETNTRHEGDVSKNMIDFIVSDVCHSKLIKSTRAKYMVIKNGWMYIF